MLRTTVSVTALQSNIHWLISQMSTVSGAPGERPPASPSGCSPEGQVDSGWMLLEKS